MGMRMLKRIDITALVGAVVAEDAGYKEMTWEEFYDEWAKTFSDRDVYTTEVVNAITDRTINGVPREIHILMTRRKSPAKALGIALRKMVGMMAENGNVLLGSYDTHTKSRVWRMVHVDPSQHL